jgi:toxin ParE1/3/4
VILHPEAQKELRDAAVYYEKQNAGLGFRFIDAVESGFRQIQRSPATWRCLRGDIRRFLVKTFPYGIVYAAVEDEIFVLAIMHLKREPDYWLGRVRELPSPPG